MSDFGELTVKHTPGQMLGGVDAKIAELEDCEPYGLATVHIPEIGASITWDDRYPRKIDPVAALTRIKDCANALAGIRDPAAFVERAKAMEVLLRRGAKVDSPKQCEAIEMALELSDLAALAAEWTPDA